MDQQIKNRLVGMAVIFALAVVFLPMILDGSGVRKDKLEVVIPAQPVVSGNPDFKRKIIELETSAASLPVLKPRFVDETSSNIPVAPEDKPVEPVVAKTSVAEPEAAPKARVGGDSWVLQVGSFQDRSKALSQRDSMRKSNIAAVFIEQFNIDGTANYRVRLGPFADRDLSRVAQNKIKAKHNIDGIIMKYER